MSSHDEEIAEMKVDIKALEAERRAATTEERKDRLLDAITAKEGRLTELMRASGNCTDRDFILCHPWLLFNIVSGIEVTPLFLFRLGDPASFGWGPL